MPLSLLTLPIMPLHLSSLSRRDFLRRSGAGAVGVLTLRASLSAAQSRNPDHWVLLSDTHVAGDPKAVLREVNMADHLRAAVSGIRSHSVAPAGVLINGDCAVTRGLPEDYATLTQLLDPLLESGLPVHCTMGNHDDREVFWNALKNAKSATPPVASKHVSVVEAERANWFLLDSLDVVNKTPGTLGAEQRDWLAKALDARTDKPALVMVHHDPMLTNPEKKTGLLDTTELFDLLLHRRHVKALIYGHTHNWNVTERDGLHLINLPAVAYAFSPTGLTGWVDCRLREGGMSLQIQAHNQQHELHGKVTEFSWRGA